MGYIIAGLWTTAGVLASTALANLHHNGFWAGVGLFAGWLGITALGVVIFTSDYEDDLY